MSEPMKVRNRNKESLPANDEPALPPYPRPLFWDGELRDKGFVIHARPSSGPVLWRRGDRVVTEEQARRELLAYGNTANDGPGANRGGGH